MIKKLLLILLVLLLTFSLFGCGGYMSTHQFDSECEVFCMENGMTYYNAYVSDITYKCYCTKTFKKRG